MIEEKTVFALFQTDKWKTKSSRVFLGIFDSEIKAVQSYLDNCGDVQGTTYEVLETGLNEFEEQ